MNKQVKQKLILVMCVGVLISAFGCATKPQPSKGVSYWSSAVVIQGGN